MSKSEHWIMDVYRIIEKDAEKKGVFNEMDKESFFGAFMHIIFDAYNDYQQNGMPKLNIKKSNKLEEKVMGVLYKKIHYEMTKPNGKKSSKHK